MLFQFTHPCGCDFNFDVNELTQGQFQFTHPCGCDYQPGAVDKRGWSFNSRTRVGATNGFHIVPTERVVSIHAPVWVRLARLALKTLIPQFQFTHPCGCDGLTNTV